MYRCRNTGIALLLVLALLIFPLSAPSANAASAALAAGTKSRFTPEDAALIAMDSTPGTGRTSPAVAGGPPRRASTRQST